MIETLFHIDFEPDRTLQDQIREHFVELILSARLPLDQPLPSSRSLSQTLGVSRNTIVLIYESLVDSGYLESRARRGFFISERFHQPETIDTQLIKKTETAPNWGNRFQYLPSHEQNIVKPNNWQEFEYPFIYGQIEKDFFPLEQWRDSVRKSMNSRWNKHWINDMVDSDDPLLIEQIRSRILPRRGVYGEPNEVLFTMGTQNSLYLLANLLFGANVTVAMENPGFRDAYNIFSMFGSKIQHHDVDQDGIQINESLKNCDYLYITPSSQVPTGAELSHERRLELLRLADQYDFIIIEDDYDSEININPNPLPALKALDNNNRVIYIGSMSKSISPGLRMGFMMADEELINEIRSLRRLMYRHPPMNNQRHLALFLSLGHYDTYVKKLRNANSAKLDCMLHAIQEHMPEMLTFVPNSQGATSVWLKAPAHINTEELAWRAAQQGILLEPGAIHFMVEPTPKNFFRLGFSAIEKEKIAPGIKALKEVLNKLI
ncbi:MocR-like pyridoxine biosynthesis transcription factor PdxR [Marinomonas epiphytica]